MNKQKIIKFSIYAAAILVAGGVLAYRREDIPIQTITGTPTYDSRNATTVAEVLPELPVNTEQRRSQFITSPNGNNQLIFDAGYSSITVHGKINPELGAVKEIYLSTLDTNKRAATFTLTQMDGQIDGSISYAPTKAEYTLLICVKYERGASSGKYIVKYDKTADVLASDLASDRTSAKIGYYFPDNGLAEKNIEVLSKVRSTPADAVKIYIAGDDWNDETVRETLEAVRILAAEITAGHNGDYEKSRAISEWVNQNIYYDNVAYDSSVTADTIALSNVLKKRRTICYGFANLYAALCQSVGVKIICVDGATEHVQSYDELLTGGHEHCSNAYYDSDLARYVLIDPGWDTLNLYDGEYIFKEPYPYFFDGSPLLYSFTHKFMNAYYIDFFES